MLMQRLYQGAIRNFCSVKIVLNEMDQGTIGGVPCPLLKDLNYNPDTIDLINDLDERNYWFGCLQDMVRKFISKAGVLNPEQAKATELAELSYENFKELIERLRQDPNVLNPLSIRTLLEFNERMLRENNFKDAWYNQKVVESKAAFKDFKTRIEQIDSITDRNAKWLEISKGVLAGNMFDWGARAVADILEISKDFGLQQAMEKIQERPWFMDDLNEWTERLNQHPYQLAVIFVDNAGVDFILGILPFARELLKMKTRVILSANTLPALNDITHNELKDCLIEASDCCDFIKRCLDEGQLTAVENGQGGPCLDLRNLDRGLSEAIKSADLIVLEGMGRAVHTNLRAEFTVDSLKMAVLKNEWLAKSLGAEQFAVVFEFKHVS